MLLDSLLKRESSGARASQVAVDSPGTFDRVLLAVDAETEMAVIETAISVATAFDASVHALSVVPMSASIDHWDVVVERREGDAEDALDAVAKVTDTVPVTKRLRYGDPAEEIELYAEHNSIDLVVTGEPNRTGLRRIFAPQSVTASIQQSVSLPVLAVPATQASAEEEVDCAVPAPRGAAVPSDD